MTERKGLLRGWGGADTCDRVERNLPEVEEHKRVDVVQGGKCKRRININRLFSKCNNEI